VDTKLTTRIGYDLTKPADTKGKKFEKAEFPQVDLESFLEE
jgi:hypothetical protein